MIRQPRVASSAGLADSRFVLLVAAAGSGGAFGRGEEAGAGPAWVRHAHSARTAALLFLDGDGKAVSDLWHDHLVCVVGARADRSFVAGQSRRVPVRPADCSAGGLVDLECGREQAGRLHVAFEAAALPAGCDRRS